MVPHTTSVLYCLMYRQLNPNNITTIKSVIPHACNSYSAHMHNMQWTYVTDIFAITQQVYINKTFYKLLWQVFLNENINKVKLDFI